MKVILSLNSILNLIFASSTLVSFSYVGVDSTYENWKEL